jgi:hypothetical protein
LVAVDLRLIPDQAIGESGGRTVDGLGFGAYATVLADAARQTPGPFTIGVFGEWGEGKTSLLRLIERDLNDPSSSGNEKIVTVWFNAWRYEREEHPVIPLIGTIVQELEKPRGLVDHVYKQVGAVVRALRAVAAAFSFKARVGLPLAAEVVATFDGGKAVEREAELAREAKLLLQSPYYQAFARLDAVSLPDQVRVVVLIDDLDRCQPDKAIWLLESIKLILGQRGFVFLLGVARKVIEGFLAHRYSTIFGITDFGGEQYLDKIVQLPFRIPPADARFVDLCGHLTVGQPDDVAAALEPVLPALSRALRNNPRALVRFINNILVDVAISDGITAAGDPAIPIAYFAVSRCVEYGWPRVFEILSRNDALAAEVSTWDRPTCRERAAGDDDAAMVAGTLVATPELRALLLTDVAGRNWLANSSLRRASANFLVAQQRLSTLDTPDARQRYDVFVSYSSRDRRDAVTIVDGLVRAGLTVFFDRDIDPGERWEVVLSRSLKAARVLCYLIGGHTPSSSGQNRELLTMVDLGMPVIPVLLPGAMPSDVPQALTDVQWLDLRAGVHEAEVAGLAAAVQRFRWRSRPSALA